MDTQRLSSRYRVAGLGEKDIQEILALCEGNPLFFRHCPPPPSVGSIAEDMRLLPPGKSLHDKHYIGFFEGGALIAVMDLIDRYPDASTMFIGFFMLRRDRQKRGIASAIIAECCAFWKMQGMKRVRLGYAKGNPQSRSFWEKNLFCRAGEERPAEGYIIVPMERPL